MSENNTYTLKVGEIAKVRPGVFRTIETIIFAQACLWPMGVIILGYKIKYK